VDYEVYLDASQAGQLRTALDQVRSKQRVSQLALAKDTPPDRALGDEAADVAPETSEVKAEPEVEADDKELATSLEPLPAPTSVPSVAAESPAEAPPEAPPGAAASPSAVAEGEPAGADARTDDSARSGPPRTAGREVMRRSKAAEAPPADELDERAERAAADEAEPTPATKAGLARPARQRSVQRMIIVLALRQRDEKPRASEAAEIKEADKVKAAD